MTVLSLNVEEIVAEEQIESVLGRLRELKCRSAHNCDFLLINIHSYRRGTARRAMSVETVRNVAQMFVELHLIIPATGE